LAGASSVGSATSAVAASASSAETGKAPPRRRPAAGAATSTERLVMAAPGFVAATFAIGSFRAKLASTSAKRSSSDGAIIVHNRVRAQSSERSSTHRRRDINLSLLPTYEIARVTVVEKSDFRISSSSTHTHNGSSGGAQHNPAPDRHILQREDVLSSFRVQSVSMRAILSSKKTSHACHTLMFMCRRDRSVQTSHALVVRMQFGTGLRRLRRPGQSSLRPLKPWRAPPRSHSSRGTRSSARGTRPRRSRRGAPG
jgi:hypothetical protein